MIDIGVMEDAIELEIDVIDLCFGLNNIHVDDRDDLRALMLAVQSEPIIAPMTGVIWDAIICMVVDNSDWRDFVTIDNLKECFTASPICKMVIAVQEEDYSMLHEDFMDDFLGFIAAQFENTYAD